jgi:dTDP-4-amino-4,6-dideoxygalactose transaminase
MTIEFGNVKIGEIAHKHIQECLDANYVTQGPKVKQFEDEWGKITGTPYNCAVNSGTSALMAMFMSLYELGAKPGDEIICPALSFVSSWTSIIAAGFKPVWVDVRRDTLGINTDLIEERITNKTQAILGVSLMGRPYSLDIVSDICRKHSLLHFCDGCEAHGAIYKNKNHEDFCDAACYSFYAAHVAFACEGGIISTHNEAFHKLFNMARNHGRKPDCNMNVFQHNSLGLNLRMTDLHACIGLESLTEFDQNWVIRKKNWFYLLDGLQDIEGEYYIACNDNPNRTASPHAFSMVFHKIEDTCKVMNALDKAGIKWKSNFGAPTFHNVFYKLGYDIKYGDFPEAEFVGTNGIHVGVHRYLSRQDLDLIINTVKSCF